MGLSTSKGVYRTLIPSSFCKELRRLLLLICPFLFQGRYFACSTHALAVNVFSKRVVNAEDSKPSYMYYVNDGIYGSFNCIMFDHYTVVPTLLQVTFTDNTLAFTM